MVAIISPEADRIIREPERRAKTGLPSTTWWRLEKAGKAPRRLQLTPHSVGWRLSEIVAWMANREKGGAPAPTKAITARREKARKAAAVAS